MHRRESLSPATPLARRPGGKLISAEEKRGSLIQSRFILNSGVVGVCGVSLAIIFTRGAHLCGRSRQCPRVQLIWKDGRRHVSTLLIHRVHPSHQNTFGCSIEAVIGDKASPTHLLLSPNIFFFFFFVSKLLWRNIDMYVVGLDYIFLFYSILVYLHSVVCRHLPSNVEI